MRHNRTATAFRPAAGHADACAPARARTCFMRIPRYTRTVRNPWHMERLGALRIQVTLKLPFAIAASLRLYASLQSY